MWKMRNHNKNRSLFTLRQHQLRADLVVSVQTPRLYDQIRVHKNLRLIRCLIETLVSHKGKARLFRSGFLLTQVKQLIVRKRCEIICQIFIIILTRSLGLSLRRWFGSGSSNFRFRSRLNLTCDFRLQIICSSSSRRTRT